MKTCLPREKLESAVLGEGPDGLLSDIELHAESCARCRHELSWLRSEVAMFSQRAAREEASRLWQGVAGPRLRGFRSAFDPSLATSLPRPDNVGPLLRRYTAFVLFAVVLTVGGFLRLSRLPHEDPRWYTLSSLARELARERQTYDAVIAS